MTDALTPRETEILALIGHGLNTRQIAARLYIAERTVHQHMAQLYPKIGAHNRTQAALHAIRVGLVKLEDVAL